MLKFIKEWFSNKYNMVPRIFSINDAQHVKNLIETAAGVADCPSREAVIGLVKIWADQNRPPLALNDDDINPLIDEMLLSGELVSDGSCLVSVSWRPNTAARIKAGYKGI